jgi:hypothetical protein
MRRRSMIVFVLFNVLISLGVAFGVISFLGPQEAAPQQVVITVPVVYTPTIGPSQTPFIVTATLATDVALLPTNLIDAAADVDLESVADGGPEIATLDPDNIDLQGTATALPTGCILHTIADGDTPFAVAQEYDADAILMMEINGLNDETATQLQIGDVLTIPLEGCPLTADDAPVNLSASAIDPAELGVVDEDSTAEATAESTNVSTAVPTVTLPPTAVTAQMEILQVINTGDVTAEGVEIRNNGDTVNISGWTLSDDDGNTFEFPEQLLFSNAQVTVYSRAGQTTAIAFFWGQNASVWETGDTLTLTDDDGVVQSTFRIP